MVPIMPSQSQNKLANSTPVPTMPIKPFAVRRDSPASSTGDSSSGRAPLTPRDGSEIGVSSPRTATTGSKEKKEEWGSGVSGLGTASTRGSVGGAGAGAGRHVKRRSVSFDDEIRDDSVASTGGGRKTKEVDSDDPEARRRERRRSEAKAAIEVRPCFLVFAIIALTSTGIISLEMSSMVPVLSCQMTKMTCQSTKL